MDKSKIEKKITELKENKEKLLKDFEVLKANIHAIDGAVFILEQMKSEEELPVTEAVTESIK